MNRRDLAQALRDRAVEVKHGGKHLRVERDGKLVATVPVSPSEYRGAKNLQLQLEKAGAIERVRHGNGERRGKRPEAPVRPYEGRKFPAGRRPRPPAT